MTTELPDDLQVLLVDDDPRVLETVAAYLGTCRGWCCTTAARAEAAAPLLPGDFDAVVSDFQMPGMDGIAFLRWMRSNGYDHPFVLYTGMSRDSVLEEALAAGASFYVRKGVGTPAELLELANAVRSAVALRAIRASPSS
ncbi:response regulator [Methanofollis fontis]|uniref:response regulator n=1 Tax=Methanofollis fontis TaxID=2052832 RepID=UPI0013EECBFF|nr:response regulator [Methanofollis fontis]